MFRGVFERIVVRRLAVPGGVSVVAVGGATLGGSGKTPLAIACAAELARSGARVALVGHAYRARPGRPRLVNPDDPIEEVGDEAIVAARALAAYGARARVVVAPDRASAIALAARAADALVLDGVGQLAPERARLALLAVDAHDPWGRRRAVAPVGELRAPLPLLVAACDAVVSLGDAVPPGHDEEERREEQEGGKAGSSERSSEEIGTGDRPAWAEPGVAGRGARVGAFGAGSFQPPMWPSRVVSRGACVDGSSALMTWDALRALRVGLLAALGRPERVARWLERRGVFARAVVRVRDHGPFGSAARRGVARATRDLGIDLWLATPKCVLHAARGLPGVPVAVLEHGVVLHPSLRTALRGLVSSLP